MITAPGEVALVSEGYGPIGADQVLAATVLSGISAGTETGWLRGVAPALHRQWKPERRIFVDGPGRALPIAPGYESVARVIECGPQVEGVHVGDLIAVDRPHADWHLLDAADAVGGLLSPETTPEQAVFFILARVALGAVHDAEIHAGDVVVVMGLGVVGLLAAQQARLNGARVIAVDRYQVRTDAAERLGMETITATEGVDVAVALREMIGPDGADVAIEASGSYTGLNEAIRCLRVTGTVSTVASYHGDQGGLRLGEEYHRNRITLRSSMTVNGCPQREHPRWDKARLDATAQAQILRGQVSIDALITHRIPFEDAAEAYGLLNERPEETIKVVLTYDHH
ncbi:zinc-binding alcohol dehydrogenase [Actinoplanes sp. NPDC051851]|uniref:zinc-dependent alcohol dehydrogenase n=1 Tax=Actinoplanes sp. NPDC051851 TaxID=3154753 RepID=UPI00342A45BC